MLLFVIAMMCASGAQLDDWARWRGPFNTGMARGEAPVSWSDGKNVAWKTPIPGRGHSSPVLWGDRIFLTTAAPVEGAAQSTPLVEHRFLVLALDAKTGKVLWEREATKATPHEGYHARYGSFASNSPVTDGKHVYAFFGSRGVYVYTLDGKLVWQKQFPPMRMRMGFGEGSAAVVEDDTLILNFDQLKGSYILALDKNTGEQRWRVARNNSDSWAPPLVIEHGGRKQVVVNAPGKVRSYDFKTGEVVWEAGPIGANAIPAPVKYNDIVIAMSGFRDPNLLAIKLGKSGDLSGTDSILWTNQRSNSYTPSPVLSEGKLYFISDNGVLSCFDAATGKAYYQQRLPGPVNFKSSPVGVNGRLYLASEEGDVLVVKMGEQFEVIGKNTLADQMFIATPAVAGGSMYLRSTSALYCIRDK